MVPSLPLLSCESSVSVKEISDRKKITGTINSKRYFKFRSNLHHVNQPNPLPESNDQFWKVKPVIEAVRKHCMEPLLGKNININKTRELHYLQRHQRLVSRISLARLTL